MDDISLGSLIPTCLSLEFKACERSLCACRPPRHCLLLILLTFVGLGLVLTKLAAIESLSSDSEARYDCTCWAWKLLLELRLRSSLWYGIEGLQFVPARKHRRQGYSPDILELHLSPFFLQKSQALTVVPVVVRIALERFGRRFRTGVFCLIIGYTYSSGFHLGTN